MIFAHLQKHWRARRRQYSTVSWLACIVRSLRVLAFYRDHQRLCQLDVYRNYVAAPPTDDLFNHLSHRHYLIKNLTVRQRIDCVLTHYSFEEANFSGAYKHAVYRAGGLVLWQRNVNDSHFAISLAMASRPNAEGDLMVAFEADGKCLHRLSFSWIEGSLVGVDSPVVLFVARNQGRWTDSDLAFGAFETAFPNNSPSFFCFAALQGVAQALDMSAVVAIKCSHHIAYNPASVKHFANAYDGFWKILGGVELPGSGHLIKLPFYVKPLADMPGKHRKRAAIRREHWRMIGESARLAVQRNLLHARAETSHSAPAPRTADV